MFPSSSREQPSIDATPATATVPQATNDGSSAATTTATAAAARGTSSFVTQRYPGLDGRPISGHAGKSGDATGQSTNAPPRADATWAAPASTATNFCPPAGSGPTSTPGAAGPTSPTNR